MAFGSPYESAGSETIFMRKLSIQAIIAFAGGNKGCVQCPKTCSPYNRSTLAVGSFTGSFWAGENGSLDFPCRDDIAAQHYGARLRLGGGRKEWFSGFTYSGRPPHWR
jgi:hypothetical protein